MAWIESHEDVGDHKKTQWLAQNLGCSIPTAVGYLHLLWHYTLKVAWRDGDLSDFIPPIIARACWFDGNPSKFIEALQGSGYMDGMKVHGWQEYAKYIIYQREYNCKRKTKSLKHVDYTCTDILKSTATITIPEPNHNHTNKNIKFAKPSVQEISEYAKSIGFNLEAEKFFDHYETTGWMYGKSHMKNWKAAVRTWKRNQGGNYVTRTTPVKNVGYASAIHGKYPD